jgi:hypothetical protein
LPGIATLTLTPFLQKEDPVILVSASEALRLGGAAGGRALPAGEALWLFQALDRLALSGLRQFVQAVRLSPLALRDLGPAELRDLVGQAIKTGRLVALRAAASESSGGSQAAELRRLVQAIERLTRGRLTLGGRQYKLVVDVDLAKVPARSSFEVASQADGRKALAGLAEQAGGTGPLADLLGQARARLSADWRPPFTEPDGLVLLRTIPVAQATGVDPGPALTPSQLQQMKQPKPDAWVKIHLVHAETSAGIKGASLSLKLPGAAAASSHTADGDGLLDLTALPSGTVTIESVDADQAWELVGYEES